MPVGGLILFAIEIVERGIREIKDWICSTRMLMQYKRVPKRFVIEIVKEVTKLVNSLPKKGGGYAV